MLTLNIKFKKTKIFSKIFILGVMPLFFGAVIYIVFRTDTILIFDWLEHLNWKEDILKLHRDRTLILLPNWVLFNLPDFLWVFGFTSVMVILWGSVKSKFTRIYILMPFSIGVISESIQYYNPNYGTFDPKDLIFYALGVTLSILIVTFINHQL